MNDNILRLMKFCRDLISDDSDCKKLKQNIYEIIMFLYNFAHRHKYNMNPRFVKTKSPYSVILKIDCINNKYNTSQEYEIHISSESDISDLKTKIYKLLIDSINSNSDYIII